MSVDDDLYAMSGQPETRFELLGGKVPVVLVDNFYQKPDEVREHALGLTFIPPSYPYPGKLAEVQPNPSLDTAVRWVWEAANWQFLTRVPIKHQGRKITAFSRVYTDFAVVDVHPDDLSAEQRIPHIDPVPVFGLIYLNREERGGTLFFEQIADVHDTRKGGGYFTASDHQFRLAARIEPRFNRLAIYPGFIPHSGEISGDWITTDGRFASPRLTQRFIFMP